MKVIKRTTLALVAIGFTCGLFLNFAFWLPWPLGIAFALAIFSSMFWAVKRATRDIFVDLHAAAIEEDNPLLEKWSEALGDHTQSWLTVVVLNLEDGDEDEDTADP